MNNSTKSQKTTKTEYSCPECGGKNIQDLCAVWVNANTNEVEDYGELHRAELYSDTRWCEDCQDHMPHWVEKEIEA